MTIKMVLIDKKSGKLLAVVPRSTKPIFTEHVIIEDIDVIPGTDSVLQFSELVFKSWKIDRVTFNAVYAAYRAFCDRYKLLLKKRPEFAAEFDDLTDYAHIDAKIRKGDRKYLASLAEAGVAFAGDAVDHDKDGNGKIDAYCSPDALPAGMGSLKGGD